VKLITIANMSTQYVNKEKGVRYSADSIIHYLSQLKNDSIISYIGLTHYDIFTTLEEPDGSIKKPIEKYKVWGIFGLGYMPGNACVLSDKRLITNHKEKFKHRIRSVALHEIGHNFGLPHCPTPECLMNDANEKISTIDTGGTTMCADCRKRME
jgi:archaemetzincin